MATQRLRHDVMGAMEPGARARAGGGELEEEKSETYLNFSDVTDAPKLKSTNMQHLN